jgi:acetate kinase
MYILVVNAGSSSLKYQLVEKETRELAAIGLCEKVGSSDSFHKHGIGERETIDTIQLKDHRAAIQAVLDSLLDPSTGAISNLDEIVAIGHRVVHGGEYFSESVIINDEVINKIEECVPLAPLHNPPSLTGIKACSELMPNAQQIAVFDTAFHQTLPPKAFMYPIPYELYEKNHIRKYGFHGTSHRYVSQRAAVLLGKPLDETKIITCHLGNGGSITAVENGKSIDTSMGFTPLAGLMMGTRSGSIDPAVVTFMINELGLSPIEVDTILNRESGLLGVSGISNDLRDVQTAADEGNERALLAVEMYANSIKKYIGQYVFALAGVDAIVLTAGVGENSADMRRQIFAGLEPLGIKIDAEKNKVRGPERIISTEDSRVKVFVIPTNEELMIVEDAIMLSS